MKELIQEAESLYKKTLNKHNSDDYSERNEEYFELFEFLKKHFLKMNNLVLSCSILNINGYASEANILARTMLESLVDFVEIFKTNNSEKTPKENIMFNITKYKKYNELLPYYRFGGCYVLDKPEEILQQKRQEFEESFIKSKKWYGKTLTEAIKDQDSISLLYKHLCFYTHANYQYSSKLDTLSCYHGLYTCYIEDFCKCTTIDYFVEEYQTLLDKIHKLKKGIKVCNKVL